MSERVLELGSTAQDMVSGFRGILTARSIHLNGCDRYWIEPPIDKEGKMVGGSWFDVTTLKVVAAPKKGLKPGETESGKSKPGGFPSRTK